MDGHPPERGPEGKKAMDRQKGEAVQFLFPSGRWGYEVVWKGARSDSSTSKLASGGETVEE